MVRFCITAALVLLGTASAMAQGVQGVHPDSSPLQVGVGLTYVRFYEAPGLTANDVGVDGTVTYYHGNYGIEGNVSDGFGSQGGKTSQLLFAGGGFRYRFPFGQTIQPWVHGVVGYSRISPMAYGVDSALGYKVGGGIDYNPRRARISYRVSVDMYGAKFFQTYQVSPQVSAGIVLALGRN
jgi:hypothetical protein